jgi:hypothetical protein
MVEGGLMMVAFWGVLIIGIVYFVRWITEQTAGGTRARATKHPQTILCRRYAAGRSTSRPTSGYAWS